MSVERRVKPSERMKNEMASKRKPLYIALAMLLVVAAFIAVWFAGRNVGRGQKEPLDITATRTMLTAKVSYDGTWVAEPDGLFEVYLPGDMIANAEDYNSLGVSVDYTDESSGQVASGFGVVVTQQEFDIKIGDDPFFVLDRISKQVVNDIAKAWRAGNASGAYDVELLTLDDGREAMRLSGDVIMTRLIQNGANPDDITQEQVQCPLLAYITLEKGRPVALWSTWDDMDDYLREETAQKMEEMVSTFWQTRYSGNVQNEEQVENNLYEEDYTISDESSIYDNTSVDEPEQEPVLPDDAISTDGTDTPSEE